jgi:hypothetical protein
LRLLGVLAEWETPSAETANDALIALNQMLDSWSTERLSVYSTRDQVFTWPANEISQTIGPSGDFVGDRPVQILDSTYFIGPNNVSYSPSFINELQYNNIVKKYDSSTYPQVMFVNNTFPNTTMHIYPRPTQSLVWHIISVQELSQADSLATELHFPPGYMRAFAYNLAMEIAPEFGVEPSPQVQRIAMTSKRNLKRINNPDDVMSMPYAVVATRNRFNIYTGYPQ